MPAPHPMTLRQLQYVVAVADLRSFRRAAEECRVSQPSLSMQIAQVEDALGVQLFERDRRKVVLTAAGEALVARARQLLVSADELVEAARSMSDPLGGSLKVGVIPTVAPYLLPEVAPTLRAEYPRLSFVWTEGKTASLVEDLHKAVIDAAVLALDAELGELSHVVLGRDAFVLAAPPGHPLASSKRAVATEELEGESVLLLDDGHCFRDQALEVCARAGANEGSYRATSLTTLVQLAAGGAGVTLLPRLAVGIENRNDALRIRPFAPKAPARTLALVWRKNAARERTLEAVGETLRKAYVAFVGRANA